MTKAKSHVVFSRLPEIAYASDIQPNNRHKKGLSYLLTGLSPHFRGKPGMQPYHDSRTPLRSGA